MPFPVPFGCRQERQQPPSSSPTAANSVSSLILPIRSNTFSYPPFNKTFLSTANSPTRFQTRTTPSICQRIYLSPTRLFPNGPHLRPCWFNFSRTVLCALRFPSPACGRGVGVRAILEPEIHPTSRRHQRLRLQPNNFVRTVRTKFPLSRFVREIGVRAFPTSLPSHPAPPTPVSAH